MRICGMKVSEIIKRIIRKEFTIKHYLVYFGMYFVYWLYGEEDQW